MAIGKSSGRIVLEVDPDLKKQLYRTLAKDGLTLKQWFLERTEKYLVDSTQLGIPFEEPEGHRNRVRAR